MSEAAPHIAGSLETDVAVDSDVVDSVETESGAGSQIAHSAKTETSKLPKKSDHCCCFSKNYSLRHLKILVILLFTWSCSWVTQPPPFPCNPAMTESERNTTNNSRFKATILKWRTRLCSKPVLQRCGNLTCGISNRCDVSREPLINHANFSGHPGSACAHVAFGAKHLSFDDQLSPTPFKHHKYQIARLESKQIVPTPKEERSSILWL